MSSKKAIQLRLLISGVALIVIDSPGEKVNTLSQATMRELNDAIEFLRDSWSGRIKGVVIMSGKQDNFIAGADINEIKALQGQGQVVGYEAAQFGKAVFAKLEALPVPTVCAINGSCRGGGTELALACTFRIASTSAKTTIGLPEVELGFIPGWGATVRLPRLIGMGAALDLISNTRDLDAHAAWKIGVVDETCAPAVLINRAEQIALTGKVVTHPVRRLRERVCDFFTGEKRVMRVMAAVLEKSALGRIYVAKKAAGLIKHKTQGNYPAPAEALKVIVKSLNGSREAAFEAESSAFSRLAVGAVSQSLVGIWTAQMNAKRLPKNASPAISVKIVGVLGGGTMGREIVQGAANSGYAVVLKDVNPEALARAMGNIRLLFDNLVAKGKLTSKEADARMALIKPTTDYRDLADCDLVIEAVLEVLAEKEKCLAALDEVITKPYIFATNTSSLSVGEIALAARHPENVIGLHFFNPPHKMKLVEVVRGPKSGEEAVTIGQAFSAKLGKTPITTGDAHGFVVNRILTPYMLEAMRLLDQGVPPADIDKAITKFGMPMGPLALLDKVGLDIAAHVVNTLNHSLGERMAPPAIMASIEALKLQGVKGGKGIYCYDRSGRIRRDKKTKKDIFNPEMLAAVTSKSNPKQFGEIQSRLVLVMVNEAARVLEEGVITDRAQLDLAMVLGTGFAPQTGGPLHYADSLGINVVYQNLANLSRVAGDNYKPCRLLAQMAERGEHFFSK
jgi:3-hydroxyacyl-CoA dehydrogenase / enoyl-CoA hydratase / 3-hydroxybutyryl-CoA epimerase